MAYSFQTFSFNEVLASSKMNQIEVNVRDHAHGQDGVTTIDNSSWGSVALTVVNGGTGAASAATARGNLGVGSLGVKNTVNNSDWGAGAALSTNNGGTGASTAPGARANLGFGSLSVLNVAGIGQGGTGQTVVSSARAALGVQPGVDVQGYSGNIPYITSVQNWSRQQNFGLQTLTDQATVAWDLNTNQVAQLQLGGNRSLAAPTNQKSGASYQLLVRQDGTGGRTLTFDGTYKFKGQIAPVLTTTASAVDLISFLSDGVNMFGIPTRDFG